jgi:hypothetical protein
MFRFHAPAALTFGERVSRIHWVAESVPEDKYTRAHTLIYCSICQSCWVARDRCGRRVLRTGNFIASQEFMGKREGL